MATTAEGMSALPPELWDVVLTQLCVQPSPADHSYRSPPALHRDLLLSVASVCKQWRTLALRLITFSGSSTQSATKFHSQEDLLQYFRFLSKNCPKLEALNLRGCTLVNDETLTFLPNLPFIHSLNLSNVGPAVTSLSNLCPFSFWRNLKRLNLDNCTKITDEALKHLPPGLEVLHLSSTLVSDAGLVYLPVGLQELYLSGTTISDAGIRSLPAHHLHTLFLSFCRCITAQGFISTLPSLQVSL